MSGDQALSDNVALQLRALIVRGALAPNEHLTQVMLAERFHLSKVPVREALKQLAAEGLLIHDRNRGYFVPPLDRAEAVQLYRLRRWLEAELLASARWPTPAELRNLRDRFAEVEAMAARGDRAEWLENLQELRLEIMALSPDRALLREAMRLWTLTDRYRAILPREFAGSNEKNLLDPLERQDRAALLAAYHADRDTIEGLLQEAFADLDGG